MSRETRRRSPSPNLAIESGRTRTFSTSSDMMSPLGDLYSHTPHSSYHPYAQTYDSPPSAHPASLAPEHEHEHINPEHENEMASLPLSEPLYTCTTVHPFIPPPDAYAPSAIPFLTLQVGDTVQILQELGSPSNYEGFANVIEDDGRDCLLIARDELGVVGWVLASFLVPLE